MENKIARMTHAVINYATLNNEVLTRIDSQFNYITYEWTTYGYTATGRTIECTERFNISFKR